jgi:SulP family sulfate permease
VHRQHRQPYALGMAAACLGGLWLWPVCLCDARPRRSRLADGRSRALAARLPAHRWSRWCSLTPWRSVTVLGLPVETIGTRFGGIPQGLPGIALPDLVWDTVRSCFMPTLTIALLGAIESLLCARVADSWRRPAASTTPTRS